MITYIQPLKPIRIKATPGDLTQSCPDLRKRNRGVAQGNWDPRNKIYADWNEEVEDERRARAAIMRMYK